MSTTVPAGQFPLLSAVLGATGKNRTWCRFPTIMTVMFGVICVASQASGESRMSKERSIRKERAKQTFDKGEFFIDDLLELTLGDPIPIEEDSFRRTIGLFLFDVCSVVHELVDHGLCDGDVIKTPP